MSKKYQIFVSSTYKDLVEERQIAIDIILKLNQIPAGMENFPAASITVFDHIKKIIDESDFFLLILAGKYGSCAPNEEISYTEKEYDYALSKGKFVIPILHKDLSGLPINKVDTDMNLREKLEKFRAKVMTNIALFWTGLHDLDRAISTSLSNAINENQNKMTGWIRNESNNAIENKTTISLEYIDIAIEKYILESKSIIDTIHIMGSSTSYHVSSLEKMIKNKKINSKTKIHVIFRMGYSKDRHDVLRDIYNELWYKRIRNKQGNNLFFYFISDYELSFRGILINKDFGYLGFYHRTNRSDARYIGDPEKADLFKYTHDSSQVMLIDRKTQLGSYLVQEFLDCFRHKIAYSSMLECIDDFEKNRYDMKN